MDSPRVILLRWKIETHAWLEAVWEDRRFGIALTTVFTACCACLFFWITPPPGVSIAVMGIAAAFMTARTKASGAEKAAWMMIISCLLVIEVSAIRKDRKENNDKIEKLLDEEHSARSEAKNNFEGIGHGIQATIELSQNQFKATVLQQSRHFDATMAKQQTNIDEVTGGHSFVVVYPDLTPTGKNEFPLYVGLCPSCQYSVPDAYIYLQRDVNSPLIGELIRHETIASNFFTLTLPVTITATTTGETDFKITVLARNKPTLEILKVRFNASLKQWECSWEVSRIEKMPHRNPKTGLAEGMLTKVLGINSWEGNSQTALDPVKNKLIP
jgi:hypothetical protein